MGNDRTQWLVVAAGIKSYRAMYELAAHIIQSTVATDRDRRAAQRLHRLLAEVIHLPIADAALLMKARQMFDKLVASLRADLDEPTVARLCLAPD